MKRLLPLVCLASLSACGGSTGGGLITVPFQLAGVQRDATQPFAFTAPTGWDITLNLATIALGPFYFNVAPPPTDAFRGGTFIMQATAQVVIDALDPTWAAAPTAADGETGLAIAVEIDLAAPDQTASDAATNLLTNNFAMVGGTATKDGNTLLFRGPITIDPALVSSQSPLQALARVNGAVAELNFTAQSQLLKMQVDPTHWFDSVDFTSLERPSNPNFAATWSTQSTIIQQLVSGVTTQSGIYSFALE